MSPDRAGASAIVDAEALREFTRALFVNAGLSREHAATVAEVLVWADLRGVDSHGVMRVPMYVRLLDAGDMNPAPAITVRTETPASVVLDVDRAAGPVAMTMAVAAAIGKARTMGIGLALTRETTHTAALGYYTTSAAEQGMAAIAFAASVPMMAYHGARGTAVSTSPISIGVPGGARGPLVLDMASSAISAGRLTHARKSGQPLAPGLAVDANGLPTTDPDVATTPLPVGGPKGSGLSLMIECVASLLVANPIIAEALNGTARGRRHTQNGFVLALDVARFTDPVSFRWEVERLVRAVKALPPDPSVTEVLVPGERSRRTLEERSRSGIPIPRAVVDDLARAADRFGVPRLGIDDA